MEMLANYIDRAFGPEINGIIRFVINLHELFTYTLSGRGEKQMETKHSVLLKQQQWHF